LFDNLWTEGPVSLHVERDDFPACQRYTYLNTASMGLVPVPVAEETGRFEQDLALGGTVDFDEEAELRSLDRARDAAAQLIGASPDQVAIVSSCTEAMCQVAWWLRPDSHSNVVSTDAEHPSSIYPWHRVARETGCEVRLAPLLDDPVHFDLERLAAYVDSNTKVIAIGKVEYLTGHSFDLARLADLAHNHGALLVVDATQAAGQVPIDVSSGVDVLTSGSYKWLCGVFGAAFCYFAPSVLDTFYPPFVGWRSAVDAYDFSATYRDLADTARMLEFSTMSYAAAFGFGASIEYMLKLTVDSVQRHNGELADRLIDGLANRGAELLTPASGVTRTGIVTARFPGRDGEEVAAQLNRRGVIVSPRVGSTRFSLHYYNNSEDVDSALAVLDDVLQ
jgi:cysteine desulfurase / selenocysteine lyase